MICPACKTENDDSVEVCFTCRAVLSAITQGKIVGGRYEILSLLGRGGMGTVYKAHDRALDEIVALKFLRPDIKEAPGMERRFRTEIKLARKVRHPNVCAIHEYGEEGSLRYIAMEFLEGVDLRRIIRERGALPPRTALSVVIQVAEGLQAIHNVGVIHRDLKTTNIMLDPAGVVRLMDFGIAKQIGADTSGPTITGNIVGTPEYMSPEQSRGGRVDFRSDIYSLGVVIYEVFTGRVPFRADTPIATIMMHLNDPPPLDTPWAAAIPPALRSVLAKALAKEPEDRQASGNELAAEIRRVQEALPEDASVATHVPLLAGTVAELRVEAGGESEPLAAPDSGGAPSTVPSFAVPEKTTSAPPATRVVLKPPPSRPAVPRPEAALPAAPRSAGPRSGRWLPFLVVPLIVLVAASYLVLRAGIFSSGAPLTKAASDAELAPVPSPLALTAVSNPGPTPTGEVGPPGSGLPVPEAEDSSSISAPRRPTALPQRPVRATPFSSPERQPLAQPASSPVLEAVAPPRVATGPGVLVLNSEPSSAISVDGEPRGRTPATLTGVPPGRHMLALISDDGRVFQEEVNVPSGGSVERNHRFLGFGSLSITSEFWVEVSVDGRPPRTTPVRIERLAAGRHVVRASRAGYKERLIEVDVPEGDTRRLMITLDPL